MITDEPVGSSLEKALTGIQGLDEVTNGGLPRGRPTLVAGGAGSGKTMLAMQFLVSGAIEYGEPGVFVAFEETTKDLVTNFRSLGYDLDELCDAGKMAIDYVYIEHSEIEETGEYDLEGLFIRLAHAIDSIGARRVVLDTIEVLSSGLDESAILRAELRRLFRWLKDRGLTAVVTGERGKNTITRYGLEEYVADCVIVLDHRVTEQISTRRLRIAKYRGSGHGTNEYPFLITEGGVAVLPITSVGLEHQASYERVSTGIPQLDEMFDGKGWYRGSSILVSGTAGTGKTSVAASFVEAACRRGERSLFFAFEESASQIIRNMRSVGIEIEPYVEQGLLIVHAERPTTMGLETHLAEMNKLIIDTKPRIVVVDPISNLVSIGNLLEVRSMLTRLIDYLKTEHVTTLFTDLTAPGREPETTRAGVSSVMDTWIVLGDVVSDGERGREIQILKSRGMKHSNRIRNFDLTDEGIKLLDSSQAGQASLSQGGAQ